MSKIRARSTIFCSQLLLILLLTAGCGAPAEVTAAEGASTSAGTSASTSESAAADTRSESKGGRTTRTDFLETDSPGTVTYGDETAGIDASNTADGYITINYNGTSSDPKVQITTPGGNKYTYNLIAGEENVFPLSEGDGSYGVTILELVSGSSYSVIRSADLDVTLKDEFQPFLYPNQYVHFEKGDSVTELGISLSDQSADDLEYITKVYSYVTKTISYDDELAANVKKGYIPDLEKLLVNKKGICFDYASLMAALLRSQSIPTKMVFGYSGTEYHAWISVYTEETGWMDNIISFDGKSWTLVDPTLGANPQNSEKFLKKYMSDSSNYTEQTWY